MVPQWDRSVNAGLIEAFESLPFGPERLLETMVFGEPFFRFNNLEAQPSFIVQILYLGVAWTRRTY